MNLLYLVGEPGVGKTTVMAGLTEGLHAIPLQALRGEAPARVAYVDIVGQPIRAVELGRRREGGFSGTDALPMAVIGEAVRYVTSGLAAHESPALLAEGARLANRRFLNACLEAGYRVDLVHLQGPEAAGRHRDARGSEQADSFIRGRRTASANLAEAMTGVEGVTVHYVPVGPETSADEVIGEVRTRAAWWLAAARHAG